MARPLVSNPRNKQLKLNLTQDEFGRVQRRALRSNMRPGEYARILLLREGARAPIADAPPAQIDRLTYQALARIGNNLNQLTRLFHATRLAPPPELSLLLREIRAILIRGNKP